LDIGSSTTAMFKKFFFIVFILSIISAQAQRVNYYKTPFNNEELSGFTTSAGSSSILLFKNNSADSCFLFDCKTNKVSKIDTKCCGNAPVSREAVFLDQQFYIIDKCATGKGGLHKIYSVNETGELNVINTGFETSVAFCQPDNLYMAVSENGKFSLNYEYKISAKTVLLNGVTATVKEGIMAAVSFSIPADSSLEDHTDP
jgi:hypothetical protein